MKNSGYIVETSRGDIGRTYHSKGTINGKVPVYAATEIKEQVLDDGKVVRIPTSYTINAILCSVSRLKIIGNID